MKSLVCKILTMFAAISLPVFSSYACFFSQANCQKATNYQLNPIWISSIVSNGACLSSLISDPKESNQCQSWTRHETAGPVLDSAHNRIYVGGTDGLLHVVSANKGELLKTIKLPGNLTAKPILKNAYLFFGTDKGVLLKMDLSDFSIVWKLQTDAEIENQVVISSKLLFVTTGLATTYAVNTETGKVAWSQKRPIRSSIFIESQPLPLVISTGRDNKKQVLAVGHPSGRLDFYEVQTGKPVFDVMVGDSAKEFPDIVADPVYANGNVIVASYNRGIAAIDAEQGGIKWRLFENKVTRMGQANGIIFAAGSNFAIGIDEKSGRKLWTFTFTKGAPSRMFYKNGFLYFASDSDALYVLQADTGEPMRYFGSGVGFASDFDFSSNVLFLVSTAGYLYAMSPDFKGNVQRGK